MKLEDCGRQKVVPGGSRIWPPAQNGHFGPTAFGTARLENAAYRVRAIAGATSSSGTG